MGCRALLLATWGNPAQWNTARYELGGESDESFTSLGILCRHLSKSGCEARALVLVLESLLDAKLDKEPDGKRPGYAYLYERREELARLRGLLLEGRYGEAVEGLRSVVEGLAKSAGAGCSGGVAVEVLPAIGSFGGGVRFAGDVRNFHSFALLAAAREVLRGGPAPSKIVVDLTHGVNFMPTYAYEVAREAASLSLLAGSRSVEMEVYNSDPYPPGSEKPSLSLNLVRREEVREIRLPSEAGSLVEWRGGRPPSRFEEFRARASRFMGEKVYPVVASLYYPLPLALVYLASAQSWEEYLGVVEEARSLWASYTRVSGGTVERPVYVNPQAVYAALLAAAACKAVREEGLSNDVESLEKLNERVYRRVSEVHYALIAQELSQVEAGRFEEAAYPRKPDKRIMIAHAGLQKGFVRVERGEKKLLLYVGADGKPLKPEDPSAAESVRSLLAKAGLKH
ncbi:CRISPR-associated CARF protein Csx1 [Thermofilum pendens]|uniref:CRISPR-associated protein, MJ1666 family n=1 Tax=Thermofilum pendens (strain DSM 2475 / Hrk 5) TaxID=368408 RepID=A1RZP0_THEPD|nr:CRISPR-associated CARF protein Csx1 [Thermofilum pendens]ABL78670.1 CRISPR-associated protein, MJ1666 family [Thermofilum pendens Hrk 5]